MPYFNASPEELFSAPVRVSQAFYDYAAMLFNMGSRLTLLPDKVREDIGKGEVLKALLTAAADLEFFFFSKLFFEKGIKSKLMKNWTLGTYIKWVKEYDMINKEETAVLEDFNELRNLIVHNRSAFQNIEKNTKELDFVKKMILAVCDFLQDNPVEYKSDIDVEKEFAAFGEEMCQKHKRIFDKTASPSWKLQ